MIPRWSHVFSFSSLSLTRPESAIGPSPGSKTSGHFAWRRGGLKHNLTPKTPWKNPLKHGKAFKSPKECCFHICVHFVLLCLMESYSEISWRFCSPPTKDPTFLYVRGTHSCVPAVVVGHLRLIRLLSSSLWRVHGCHLKISWSLRIMDVNTGQCKNKT